MVLALHTAKITILTAALTAMVTLTGCANDNGLSNPLDSLTGEYKYAPDYIKTNVIANKSTKEDIRQKFGAPSSVMESSANGTAIWVYDRSKSGLTAWTDMASKYAAKYGNSELASQVWEGKSQMNNAQEAMTDAQSLSGTNVDGRYAKIREISIRFKGDVVDGYTTY